MSDTMIRPDVDDVRTWPREMVALLRDGRGVATEVPRTAFRFAPYGSRVMWSDEHARRLWEHVLGVVEPVAS